MEVPATPANLTASPFAETGSEVGTRNGSRWPKRSLVWPAAEACAGSRAGYHRYMPKPRLTLSDDELDFVCGPRSMYVAGCSPTRQLSVARALACRVSDDGAGLLLLLHPHQAEAVLAAIEQTRRIAVVYSAPETNKTLQLKGVDAERIATPTDSDALAAAHLAGFTAVIGPMGFSAALVSGLVRGTEVPLVAVRFTPQSRFEQTPGPAAGAQL